MEEDEKTSYKNSEIESWTDIRSRIIMQLSFLDSKFPNSFRLMRVSKNIIKLGTHLLEHPQSEDNFSKDLKEELFKIVQSHKERIGIETSELAREIRDSPLEQD